MKRFSNRTTLITATLLSVLALPALAEKPMDGEGKQQGKSGGKHHGQKMIEKFDLDGDGRINKAEFMAMHGEKFDRMDSNSDGFIEPDERKAHRQDMKAKHQKMKEKRQQKKAERAE